MSNEYFTRRKGKDYFTSPRTTALSRQSAANAGTDAYTSKTSSGSSCSSSVYGSVRTMTVKKTYAIRKN